jgi:L-ascorbate metabolism protein UlaG (beta-lactamase superfamily)
MDILEGVSHLNHASIKFERGSVVYVDPYQIDGEPHDADMVFCTHDHFDHLSMDDIKKVMNENSILVVPVKNAKKFKKFPVKEVVGVEPSMDYEAGGVKFKTVRAYNLDKKFHPKKKNWVGFVIYLEGTGYYISGDTDYIPEMDDVEADVAFLPVSGTYVCTAEEAARAANSIKPKVAVPIHFGSVVGTAQDADLFIEKLDSSIKGVKLM